MSLFAEVKCARCDRKYSGLRSRCPFCGARRIGRGKYSEETDNSRGKMLIGILILAVLVVAAGVLLFTTPKPAQPAVTEPDVDLEEPSSTPGLPGDDANVGFPGIGASPSKEPDDEKEDDTTTPAPVPTVQSVTITYDGRTKTDFTAGVGERVPLRARIEPVGIEEEIIWESSNPDVFQVVAANTEGTAVTVTGVGRGTATLTVTVGDQKAECIVRVR